MSKETYLGMNAITGRRVTGDAHIIQSIKDILTTPKFSRVMRRQYGADLQSLIDHPVNEVTCLRIMSAVYSAIYLFERRVSLTHVELEINDAARYTVKLKFQRADTLAPFTARIAL